MSKSKVYFTKDLSSHSLVKLLNLLDKKLTGNVAVKIHSGEEGNQNYLRPDYLKEIVEYVHGTVVECNTAYDGERNTTEKHLNLLKNHGWSTTFKMDLLDSLKYVEQNFNDRVVFIIGSFYIYGAVADYLANLKVWEILSHIFIFFYWQKNNCLVYYIQLYEHVFASKGGHRLWN